METEFEFSRPFALAGLGDGEAVVEIAANPGERAALARRFGLVALGALTATVRLRRGGNGAVELDVRCVAEVVQSCVVTLEPVAARLRDAWSMSFAPPASAALHEVTVAPSEEDEPEPLRGDTVDVGEVVAVHVGLILDPYPRRPGAVFDAPPAEESDDVPAASPFAALRDLHRKS